MVARAGERGAARGDGGEVRRAGEGETARGVEECGGVDCRASEGEAARGVEEGVVRGRAGGGVLARGAAGAEVDGRAGEEVRVCGREGGGERAGEGDLRLGSPISAGEGRAAARGSKLKENSEEGEDECDEARAARRYETNIANDGPSSGGVDRATIAGRQGRQQGQDTSLAADLTARRRERKQGSRAFSR